MDDFDDHTYLVLTELLVSASKEFDRQVGRLPTKDEFAELLTSAAQHTSTPLLSDARNQEVVFYVAGSATAAQDVSEGDLIAVPLGERWGAILYLGKFGRFGSAFGVYDGCHTLADLADSWTASTPHEPVFVMEDYLEAGRWVVLSSRVDLLNDFPTPAKFYPPDEDDEDEDEASEFGFVEFASGESRPLTETEFSAVFQGPSPHHSPYNSAQLEEHLRIIATGRVSPAFVMRPESA